MAKKDASAIFTQAAAVQEKRYADTTTNQTASDELVQVILRVPAETRRQMKIKAATLDISMNDYVRNLIEDDLG